MRRVVSFVLEKYILLVDAVVDEFPCIFEVHVQLIGIQVFHDIAVFLTQVLECFEVVQLEEVSKCSILEQNRFLINLEVCVRLPQIVHLHHEELVASLAHLVLQLFNLRLYLLKTDGVLADGLGRMLYIEHHIVKLVYLFDI